MSRLLKGKLEKENATEPQSATSGSTPSQSTYPAYAAHKPEAATYVNVGALCAIIALFIVPELFGAAAIILGAYAWRLDCAENKSRGVWAVVFGIVAMLIGIYYTSLFGLYNILP